MIDDNEIAELIDFRFPHVHKFKIITDDITCCDCGVCMNGNTGKLWRMKSIYDN